MTKPVPTGVKLLYASSCAILTKQVERDEKMGDLCCIGSFVCSCRNGPKQSLHLPRRERKVVQPCTHRTKPHRTKGYSLHLHGMQYIPWCTASSMTAMFALPSRARLPEPGASATSIADCTTARKLWSPKQNSVTPIIDPQTAAQLCPTGLQHHSSGSN